MRLFDTEADLAAILVKHLKELKWTVYQEVDLKPLGGIADIIATQNNLLWVIEAKLNFGLSVIAQTERHIGYANYVSILTPARTSTHYKILKLLGIGHIQIGCDHYASETVRPKLNRKKAESYKKKLCPEQLTHGMAGTASGDRFSPFKRTVGEIKSYISLNPGCSIKQAIENVDHHYSSFISAKSSILYWIKSGIIEDIEILNRKLFLKKRMADDKQNN